MIADNFTTKLRRLSQQFHIWSEDTMHLNISESISQLLGEETPFGQAEKITVPAMFNASEVLGQSAKAKLDNI
jgi:hypothetical protein